MDIARSFNWRPRTTVLLLGGFTVIVIALSVSFVLNNLLPTVTVYVGSGMYDVELANTDKSREKGLGGVKELPINGGLLMDFKEEGLWGIWMKDMNIPIDIIWLNESKKVVYVKKGASPSTGTQVTYVSKSPARYVLELPAGSVDASGIKINQLAQFTLKDEQE